MGHMFDETVDQSSHHNWYTVIKHESTGTHSRASFFVGTVPFHLMWITEKTMQVKVKVKLYP